MDFVNNLFVIIALIASSAFFSCAEIALASSRKIRLQQLVEAGNVNAAKVLALQEEPGNFFTVIQVALNAIAIMGGILGEQAFSPYIATLLENVFGKTAWLEQVSFLCSFTIVTSLFIIFADLMPKRLAIIYPEQFAVAIVKPILFFLGVLKPIVRVYDGIANLLFKLLNIKTDVEDAITFDDVSAMVDAGTASGALHKQEQHLIENVFELDTRTVTFAMTSREHVIFLRLQDDEQMLTAKISDYPHSRFLVCNDHIDNVLGYVESKDILKRTLKQQAISLNNELQLKNLLAIPDTLTLSELLERFKVTNQDLAVILNEYALVVGIVTLNDVMKTLMGDLVSPFIEEQIVKRDDNSWLIDGVTPIEDVRRALSIDSFPNEENYQTIAGLMMYLLKKIPKRTDFIEYAGYKFEVVDIDNYRIDQLLVTKILS
ncbi:MAG TPA: hemolysin family protein [Agitococcus sp.]|nr:hemolysin family protein [Agitococcus sp.]HMV60787.1 hemolysin family protein [Agitococcus sp.]HMX99968.1 hemolysin family protein [Agitococcus sp.]HMY28739.1 hemolysin family protein [Agitococcus sp.]HMY82519.1 hemolysin family protein [Agitococcus sp.]